MCQAELGGGDTTGAESAYSKVLCPDRDPYVLTVTLTQTGVPFLLPANLNAFLCTCCSLCPFSEMSPRRRLPCCKSSTPFFLASLVSCRTSRPNPTSTETASTRSPLHYQSFDCTNPPSVPACPFRTARLCFDPLPPRLCDAPLPAGP